MYKPARNAYSPRVAVAFTVCVAVVFFTLGSLSSSRAPGPATRRADSSTDRLEYQVDSSVPLHLYSAVPSSAASEDFKSCSMKFDRYISSDIEKRWLDNIGVWQDQYCAAFRRERRSLQELMAVIESIRYRGFQEIDVANVSRFISRLEFTVQCGSHSSVRHSWIEPLVGFLRYPLSSLCPEASQLSNRSYIILDDRRGLPESVNGEKFYFDLGASLYSAGPGGASQKYFVEEYAQRGVDFDQMYLWEPKPRKNVFQDRAFNGKLLHKYHYYNTFADPEPGADFNPHTLMKRVAKPEDFVMYKLDIDTPVVEGRFQQQLEQDEELAGLVDEFFYEHHCNFGPMRQFWKKTIHMDIDLQGSYQIFLRLRQKGIRAHGWP